MYMKVKGVGLKYFISLSWTLQSVLIFISEYNIYIYLYIKVILEYLLGTYVCVNCQEIYRHTCENFNKKWLSGENTNVYMHTRGIDHVDYTLGGIYSICDYAHLKAGYTYLQWYRYQWNMQWFWNRSNNILYE